MSVVYGLTSTGFTPKPQSQIRTDLNTALQNAFGQSIDVSDKSVLGQISGILSESYAALWAVAQQSFSAIDPDAATATSLDAVSAFSGTDRPAAAASFTTETLFGVPGTVVPAGNLFDTASTKVQFASTASATIAAVPAWAGLHVYAVGNRVFSDTQRIYQCITAGMSASSPAVSGTGSDITDGTVHWKMIQDNVPDGGAVDVKVVATATGPINAVAGDLTGIVTPVVGLTSVTNLADVTPGRNVGTDEELRILREEELSGAGQTPPDAIRAALLKISGVTSATVFANNTDTTDGAGRPPHSVECLVRTTWAAGDPLDQEIVDAVFQNVAAGIASFGNTTGTSTDSQGTSHTVYFSRPTEVLVYVIVNVTVDASTFPSDGATEIQTAITTWGAAQAAGKDVVASAISAQAFSIAGVLDVTSCFIGTSPSPASSATIAVDLAHLAVYDTSRITVNVTNGTP